MHWSWQQQRGGCHERAQQPRSGSRPRCGGGRLSRSSRGSRAIASAVYLTTLEFFSVPLQHQYNLSFAEQAMCRFVDAFNIFALAQILFHDWPVSFVAL